MNTYVIEGFQCYSNNDIIIDIVAMPSSLPLNTLNKLNVTLPFSVIIKSVYITPFDTFFPNENKNYGITYTGTNLTNTISLYSSNSANSGGDPFKIRIYGYI